jgi:hypothetical protein
MAQSEWLGRDVLTVLAATTTAVLGRMLMSPRLEHHEVYRAKTVSDFFIALTRNLAWPFVESPWMVLIVSLPLAVFAAQALLTRRHDERPEYFILAMGAWFVMQAGAIAYARGAGGAIPSSRYMDTLAIGTIVNGAAAMRLTSIPKTRAVKLLATAGLVAWCGVEVIGQDQRWPAAIQEAQQNKSFFEACERNLRAFVQTDDIAPLLSEHPPIEVPFLSASMLANAWLRHPTIRRILPASIRQPLPVTPESTASTAFVPDGYYPTTPADPIRRASGSYAAAGDAALGKLISRPMVCSQGKDLVFDVAGYLGRPGLKLLLNGKKVEQTLGPPLPAREAWIPVAIACPPGPFTITAVDGNTSSWFAFREPVESGRLSTLATWLVGRFR